MGTPLQKIKKHKLQEYFVAVVRFLANHLNRLPMLSLCRSLCFRLANLLNASDKKLTVPENKYFFEDNIRQIDYVLIPGSKHLDDLQKYLKNLEEEGLNIEEHTSENILFIKVHVPTLLLYKYCDTLQIKLPVKEEIFRIVYPEKRKEDKSRLTCFRLMRRDEEIKMMAAFITSHLDLFDLESDDMFNQNLRSMIAYIILNKAKFSDSSQDMGLGAIYRRKMLKTAFPLHDGFLDEQNSRRSFLRQEWGSFTKVAIGQPLDEIKDYYGLKIGLYFMYVGFYTYMLIPAAIMGVVAMIFGAATLSTDKFSHDVCHSDFVMCPLCDVNCDFWHIKQACTYTKLNYFFDNDFTIVFAIFMSVWSTIYLELWKRYCASRTHHWGLTGYKIFNEIPRPEYMIEKKKRSEHISYWNHRFPWLVLSFASALGFAFLACLAVFSVIIYRIALRTAEGFSESESRFTPFIIPITASVLNLLAIYVLNIICDIVAYKLTKMELQRTQTEFNDSLTLKVFLFQFVNSYASIFYIAFFKGKLVGYPENYKRLFSFRQEECNPGGCLMELCIQLAIVMVGKQAANNVIEILIPYFKTLITQCWKHQEVQIDYKSPVEKQVIEDMRLEYWTTRTLFPEYLEMVIQYGFITLFVTAFPLAPLFALINNIIEIRLDAKKFLMFYRRPVSERVKTIGVWFNIIKSISMISVLTNALVIAFSSNFIPQLVYKSAINEEYSEKGYLNFSLSLFDVKDLEHPPKDSEFIGLSQCYYTGFRTPPSSTYKYTFTATHWLVLAAKLAFVVIYQNAVYLLILFVQWAIPDIPGKIKEMARKEAELLREKTLQSAEVELMASKHVKRS